MRLFGTIFSAILALLAIPLFTIAACNFAIEAAVFSRTTYDAVLEDDVIFEDLLTVALPVVLTIPDSEITLEDGEELPPQVQNIVTALEGKPEVWAQINNLLIPPDWLQTTTTQLMDVIFGLIDGDIDVINEEVDLSDIRARFFGDEVRRAASLIITEAPQCDNEQRAQLERAISGIDEIIPICNPQDTALEAQSIELLITWFQLIARNFDTDRIPVSQVFDIDRDGARAFSLVMELIFEQALILFYLCPMALVSLIVLATVRALGEFGRWIGGVLTAVGVLILLMIFGLQVFTFGTIGETVGGSTSPAEQFLARFGNAMLRSAVGESSASLLTQAALFIGLGFAFFALAWYFGRKRDEGSVVIITEDGEVISTATQRRVGMLGDDAEDNQPVN